MGVEERGYFTQKTDIAGEVILAESQGSLKYERKTREMTVENEDIPVLSITWKEIRKCNIMLGPRVSPGCLN